MRALFSSLLLGAGALACQDPPTPPPAAPQAAPPDPRGAASMPKGAAPMPHGAAPHGGVPPSVGGAPVTGVIQLAEGADPKSIQASDVLFVMARKSQGDGKAGALVAVKRFSGLEEASFPLRFELGAADVMTTDVPFAGPFIVYARLDRDGDPMTRTVEDLYGTVADPVANGAANLKMDLKPGTPEMVGSGK